MNANHRILIVEDEAITVAALRRELVSLGYEIACTAGTANAAFNRRDWRMIALLSAASAVVISGA